MPGLATYLDSSERTVFASAAPEELSSLAADKLLALLTEYGHLTSADLDASYSAERAEGRVKEAGKVLEDKDTLLRFAMQLLEKFRTSAAPLLRDEGDEEGSAAAAVGAAASVADSLSNNLAANEGTARLRASLSALLRIAAFHTLACEDVDTGVLADLAAAAAAVVASDASLKTASKKAVEEEEVSEPQVDLLDACVELLSVSSQQSVRGVKEGVKRVWATLSGSGLGLTPALVEAAVAAIAGDDAEEADEGEDDTDFDAGLEEEEEEEEEGEGEKGGGLAKKSKGDPEAAALDAIVGEMTNSDDEDSFGEVQHDESADSALAVLITLRQQSRKNGIMEAKRLQLVNRSRVIDIFEAIIARCDDGSVLLPCFEPLMRCLRKLQTQSLTLSLQEGRDFEHRLRVLLGQRLCQKRFSVTAASDEEHSRLREEVEELLSQLFKLLSGSVIPMRAVAAQCIATVARAVLGGNSEGCRDLLVSHVQSCFTLFVSKKNSKVSSSLFDDMLSRFPSFFLSALGGPLVEGCVSTQVAYLKAECFRLSTLLVKRYKSLSASEDDRDRFHIALPLMLDAVSRALGAHSAGGVGGPQKEKELLAKRLRPVVSFAKELIVALKMSAQNGFPLSKLSAGIKKFKQVVDSDISSALSSSPVVMQQLRNISDSLGGLGEATTALTPTPKGGARKRKTTSGEAATALSAKATAKKVKE